MSSMLLSLQRRFRFVRYSVRAIGVRTLVRNALGFVVDREARSHDSGFDRRFGTDTTEGVTPEDAALPEARRAGATMYLPTMDQDLTAMLDALAWPDELRSAATFIDIGSGKGRVVLLAAMQRFREVVGVELSASLHAIAMHNVACVGEAGALRSPVRLVHQDAATYAIPDGPLIVYLYHPFREDIASELVAHVVASCTATPRPIAIVYGHPTLQPSLPARVFEQGDVFRKATDGVRRTRAFAQRWSIWTNLAWLALPHARSAPRAA